MTNYYFAYVISAAFFGHFMRVPNVDVSSGVN